MPLSMDITPPPLPTPGSPLPNTHPHAQKYSRDCNEDPDDHEPGPESEVATGPSKPSQKRNRAQLSCTNCRHSKLKCDRKQPCSQCIKRGKISQCTLPQQVTRRKPAVSMQNRLKHLESLVKDVMSGQSPSSVTQHVDDRSVDQSSTTWRMASISDESKSRPTVDVGPSSHLSGNVMFRPNEKSTYVGATHWAAILEDIEEVKSYFEEAEEVTDDDDIRPYSSLAFNAQSPATKPDLISALPTRLVVDRFISRYFNSNSPSLQIMHRPSFQRAYKRFWADPEGTPISWLALVYAIMIQAAVAVLGSGEEFADLRGSPMEMVHTYRECCVQCLVLSNYTKPGPYTMETLSLYMETEFLLSIGDQVHCYLLCGNAIRLALRMGLHRDATKVGGGAITPFQAEMRRRIWYHLCQIDLLGSTHMGLPGMINSVASDSIPPKNLRDEDFDEDSIEIPPSRPESELTPMSYTICKGRICLVSTKIAAFANLLTDPPYDQVMGLDRLLHEAFSQVPQFYRLDLSELAITESPDIIIKKYSIELLYHSSRCMLHRKFLLKQKAVPEYGYSKVVGLDASIQLLRCQASIHEATSPGGPLARDRWFFSTLSLHNFLVANMVVYLTIMQSFCGPDGHSIPSSALTKDQQSMIQTLEHSNTVWQGMIEVSAEAKKCAAVVAIMMKKVHLALGDETESTPVHQEMEACEMKTTNLVSRLSLSGFESTNASFLSAMEPQNAWTAAMAQSTISPSGLGMPLEAELITSPMEPFGDMVGLPDGFDWEVFDNHVRPPPAVNQPWPDFQQSFGVENIDYYDL
ncbi:fungal-specific transcription factor domain-containing protein [Leptodontidium sp. MPI-SDFR-AT-0119]|nr:fungal-specific transcription factor domain-containing protein [Leptodontidium sp. MPI-SDFR-AT-0119]